MKATELRTGNFLEYNPNDEWLLSAIDWRDIWWADQNERGFNKNHRPIPLTEEWLLKFGFKKPAHAWIGDKFHLSTWDDYPDCWCAALNKNNGILVSKLKHVHQLQNLYFALTGKELILKDDE